MHKLSDRDTAHSSTMMDSHYEDNATDEFEVYDDWWDYHYTPFEFSDLTYYF